MRPRLGVVSLLTVRPRLLLVAVREARHVIVTIYSTEQDGRTNSAVDPRLPSVMLRSIGVAIRAMMSHLDGSLQGVIVNHLGVGHWTVVQVMTIALRDIRILQSLRPSLE